jgi:hypothetical protein
VNLTFLPLFFISQIEIDISSSSSFLLRLPPFLAGALIPSFPSSHFLILLYFYIPFLLFLDAIRTANLSFYLPIFFGSGQPSPHPLMPFRLPQKKD